MAMELWKKVTPVEILLGAPRILMMIAEVEDPIISGRVAPIRRAVEDQRVNSWNARGCHQKDVVKSE